MLARQRRDSHSRRSIDEVGVSTSYPWAVAGINITRMLAELYSLVNAAGAPNRRFHEEHKLFWQLADEYHELYCVRCGLGSTRTVDRGHGGRTGEVVAVMWWEGNNIRQT